jgi:large subunit ribosomal protein L4
MTATKIDVDLPAEVFGVQANVSLIHQVVVAQLAAARQGTHAVKTRAQVSGGGRKPYRQKGTGRARQGSIRAPHFAGGGVAHGPVSHNYEQRTPKKMKAAALRGALSDRARFGRVHVVSDLVGTDVPSTKTAVASITAIVGDRSALIVLRRDEIVAWKSFRNVPNVHVLEPGQLNTYDVLVFDDVVFSEAAYETFVGGNAAAAAQAKAEADAPSEAAPSDSEAAPSDEESQA